MNDLRDFQFFSKEHRNPYIQELYEFNILETEGFIYFNGYYYVLDNELPRRLFINTYVREKEPYEDNGHQTSYKIIENDFYEVDVYKIEKIENTNNYSELDDEDGSTMTVCFFPTDKQKIYFKIINKFNRYEEMLDKMSESFTKE
jgi:hypothetical protein